MDELGHQCNQHFLTFSLRMLYMTVRSERKGADVNCSIERVYIGAWSCL